ncbi:hypothetical protein LDG_8940 [Legionella drancourtii LLAP12]|uniref:Uncharacterized protein n=1 Tax=Legionella drancourtii LLAP12 TaxID=658187 RepID=G9EUE6_9GAMM|nr:hypothetical protein LDG_8940 [Legionella drancourtii LLAP12]
MTQIIIARVNNKRDMIRFTLLGIHGIFYMTNSRKAEDLTQYHNASIIEYIV